MSATAAVIGEKKDPSDSLALLTTTITGAAFKRIYGFKKFTAVG